MTAVAAGICLGVLALLSLYALYVAVPSARAWSPSRTDYRWRWRGPIAPVVGGAPSRAERPEAHDELEVPEYDKGLCELVRHTAYTAGYSRGYQQPQWVAYRLDREELVKRASRKSHRFVPDPTVPGMTVDRRDYHRSGYDQGHMAPAGDMSFDLTAMRESFYYTNVSPQIPRFNRGVWSRVERYARGLADRYGSVYVVTGPSFHSGAIDSIGDPPIPVPSHFFKAFLVEKGAGWSAVGILLPHSGSTRLRDGHFVPIDSIERVTGLDLYAGLPDSIEDRVEREVVWEDW